MKNFLMRLNKKELFLLLFLFLTAGFSSFIQLISLLIFSLWFLFVSRKVKLVYRYFFYFTLLSISVVQVLLVWKEDYQIGFVINSIFISVMWFFALQSSNIVVKSVFGLSELSIEKILNITFKLNLIFVLFQFFSMCLEMQTAFPFSSMSAGDNIKGIFRNSSVNMIIMSFYTVYYAYRKKYKLLVLAIIVMVSTFYMSGLVLMSIILFLYTFFMFSLGNKFKVFIGAVIIIFVFTKISPNNVGYVKHILTDKITSKTVSFKQTLAHWTDHPINFVFGAGGGKFSSRAAFITAGEYVSWYPKNIEYKSSAFKNNHFSLWNNEILSKSFKDGTSNQPFSFYNKIIGEYGLFGMLLFVLFLFYYIKHYKILTYGKILLPLLLVYFLLDYWFEYFSVIIFFELFLFLDIKNRLNNSFKLL